MRLRWPCSCFVLPLTSTVFPPPPTHTHFSTHNSHVYGEWATIRRLMTRWRRQLNHGCLFSRFWVCMLLFPNAGAFKLIIYVHQSMILTNHTERCATTYSRRVDIFMLHRYCLHAWAARTKIWRIGACVKLVVDTSSASLLASITSANRVNATHWRVDWGRHLHALRPGYCYLVCELKHHSVCVSRLLRKGVKKQGCASLGRFCFEDVRKSSRADVTTPC